MKSEALRIIALKLVLVENEGLFDDDELKIIRARSFLSCVVDSDVCLSVHAVAELANRSQVTIRNWCRDKKIISYSDSNGWWEIPLREVVNLKRTNWDTNKYLKLDIKKVDF